MLQWLRNKRNETPAIAFAASPGAALVDFLLGQLEELEGAEPLLERVETFRLLPLDDQERQLPATYLYIERYLINIADSPLDRMQLRQLVAGSHAALLDSPSFCLIFEPEGRQQILLCRELLLALLDRSFELLGATGGNLVLAIRDWLSDVPDQMPLPIPLGIDLPPPQSTRDWVRVLTHVTRALYERVERILGRGAARRMFEGGYSDLAQRYLDLPTFSVIIDLLPEHLLDERKIRELNRGQMRQVVLDKVERLQRANEKLSDKNQQLEEARSALEKVNGELEDRVRDRTEALRRLNEHLRESEEKLRRITQAANDAIVMWDSSGKVSFWNRGAERIFGYSKADILDQDVCKALIPWRFHSLFRRGLKSLEGTDERLVDGETVEWTIVDRSRQEFPVELSLSSVKLDEHWHALAVIRDIRERKRDEEERRQLEEQMRQNQRLESLGLMAGGIAHDFNNVLSTIVGNAGLAKRRVASDDAWRENLANIETAAARASDLTRQMLAYSGGGQFALEPLDLSDLVDDMAQLLQVSISKRCDLACDLGRDLPAIEADRSQIQQVAMNLITNASDALEDSAGSITVKTGVLDADRNFLADCELGSDLNPGQYVYAEVSDTGCGMDAETRAKIFEPFFSTKFVGRGLGLAAVSGIVRGHSGAILIRSQPQEGTTIRVLFPASAKLAEPMTKAPEPKIEEPDDFHQGGTILVVDDESDVRDMVQVVLEELGFRVLSAADGLQAIDVFRGHAKDIDLVLMDMTMPKMDGREAFRKIRELQADARVILSSGYSRKEALRELHGEKALGFLKKPYTLPALTAELRSALTQ